MEIRNWWWRPATLALALAVCWAVPAAAQQRSYTITGKVLDATTQEALASAQVSVQGTRFGGLTDDAGVYTVRANLPPGDYTLVVSYLGRTTREQQVTLGTETTVQAPDILMQENALSLQAVVVTGTATPTSKRALGNSVTTVTTREIQQAPVTTIDQALQGNVPGAVIFSNTGEPGGGVSVRLRGTSSIVGGAEPLYIIDGVIVDNSADQQVNFGYRSNPSNRLADLDPNDIDHIEILKGAAAASLYGSRANNGVIQIFTKRGQAGAPQVTLSSRETLGKLPHTIPFAMTPVDLSGAPVQRYDPQSLIFQTAVNTDDHLAVSGGAANTRYYFSGNYTNQQGIMKGSGYNKIDTRLNLDQTFGGTFKLSAGANYIHSHYNLDINGENGTGGLLTAIVFTPTTVNLAARNPETGELINTAFVFPNPLDVLARWKNTQDINRFVGSLGAHWTPLTHLTFDYRFGYDEYGMSTAQYIPRGATLAPLGGATNVSRNNYLINNDLIGNYDLGIGDAQFTTSVGMNHTYLHQDNVSASASDLTPGTKLVSGAVQSASESQVATTTLGFFGQEQFGWKNRLFLTGAVRWDASSTFGADQRWQIYPKLSGSYVISDEPFWKNSSIHNVLPQLRFRAALGYAGNQPPTGLAYSRFSSYGSIININRLGLVPLSLAGNPNLKPERQREYETGFDAQLFSPRISLSFTYYNQRTSDLLTTRPFAPSTGYSSVIDNIGVLKNTGIEAELNTTNIESGPFRWQSALIYSRNKNLVEQLYGDPYTVGYNNRVQQGQSLGVFYMSAFERDASGNIVTDSLGAVRAATNQIVGSPWPTWTGSMRNEFSYGSHWTASFLLDGSFGQKLWNQTRRIQDIFGSGPEYDLELKGEWSHAKLVRYYGIWENYLENASYVKLRDFTLGYTETGGFVSSLLHAHSATFQLVGHDLYTWTGYSGYDPEVNMFGTNTVERGTDFAVYPHPRTFGIDVRLTY